VFGEQVDVKPTVRVELQIRSHTGSFAAWILV
jgi:hypothetical protein